MYKYFNDLGQLRSMMAGCSGTSPLTLYINGLVQERRNSSVLAMKLNFSCTNPSPYTCHIDVLFLYRFHIPCQWNNFEYELQSILQTIIVCFSPWIMMLFLLVWCGKLEFKHLISSPYPASYLSNMSNGYLITVWLWRWYLIALASSS